jgi:hypothetical protein
MGATLSSMTAQTLARMATRRATSKALPIGVSPSKRMTR